MRAILNPRTLLWAIGVLQPVSPSELQYYLSLLLGDAGDIPNEDVVYRFCLDRVDQRHLIRVHRQPDMFSLSKLGNQNLTGSQRRSRDKLRFYLLRDSLRGRMSASREVDAVGLGGVAPSADARPSMKGTEANRLGSVVPSGQAYWPRFSRQLVRQTGPSHASRDVLFPYLSFASSEQLALACRESTASQNLDFTSLGLMLGVSPRLVQQISRKPERHYRSFQLSKRGGGTRLISSPRIFLKVIQRFILDYLFCLLPVSEAVFSFRPGLSITQHASLHVGREFVGNADIENFFGSINRSQVYNHLCNSGFSERSAKLISALTTSDDVLPQGAPTSPAISNSLLLPLDDRMLRIAGSVDASYSRYADDITFSGDNREVIEMLLFTVRDELRRDYGFRLNREKTRVSSKHGQQRVTGLVVNECALPPRVFRRRVRAMFHNARVRGVTSNEELNVLNGYLSYLRGFDALRHSSALTEYGHILRELRCKMADA